MPILGVIASSRLTAVKPTSVDYLVVAGGGGGGNTGAGAGGYRTGSLAVSGSFTVTVGAG